MNKQEIISEIKRITAIDGKAPGIRRFSTETGIPKSGWYPDYWLRWSDAVEDAGLQPNVFTKAHDNELLIIKYIELIRELGHFPIDGELKVKRKKDKNFPSDKTFNQLGLKQERLYKIINYCHAKTELQDIVSICSDQIKTSCKSTNTTNVDNVNTVGYVYLIRHGKRNEYKIGRTNNPIRREGEIRLELPEKIQPIHYIETDDPAGIENYWHKRFASKRKEGEWFALTETDIRAFKKWRKIC